MKYSLTISVIWPGTFHLQYFILQLQNMYNSHAWYLLHFDIKSKGMYSVICYFCYSESNKQ